MGDVKRGYCLGIKLEEHQRSDDIRKKVNITDIRDLMAKRRLEWFGHVRRRKENEDIRKAADLKVKGKRKKGRLKHRWRDTINPDLKLFDLNKEDTHDCVRWECLIELGLQQKPATRKDSCGER